MAIFSGKDGNFLSKSCHYCHIQCSGFSLVGNILAVLIWHSDTAQLMITTIISKRYVEIIYFTLKTITKTNSSNLLY